MSADDWRPPPLVPPDAAEALPSAIRDWEHSLRPGNAEHLAAVVAKLLMHFWTPDMPPGHYDALAGDWIDDLAEYPVECVIEAARDWRRRQTWAPKICEMRQSCDELVTRRRRELLRLKVLALAVERHGGQVPVLWTRLGGDRLVDYEERATSRHLEALLRDERDMGGMVWALPSDDPAPKPAPPPPPPLAAMIAEAEATPPAEPPPPPPLSPRDRVLRILLVGGISVPEIEAGKMLDVLDETRAQELVDSRKALVAAVTTPTPEAAPDPGTVEWLQQKFGPELWAKCGTLLKHFEVRVNDETIVLDAPTRFARQWVEDRFGAALRRAANGPVEIVCTREQMC